MNNTLRSARAAGMLALPLAIAVLVANRPGMPPLPADAPGDMAEVGVRNLDIKLFEERTRADAFSAGDRARLASLYMQRARETGDYEDFRRAENEARESVRLRTERNGGGYLMLASSLLAQHRFAEARTAADQLVALDPDKASYRSLLGEIQLELGDYDAAQRTFSGLHMQRSNLAVAPRFARWLEVTGHDADARQLLGSALEEARSRTDLPREQVAWFFLRVADFDVRHGKLDEAERAVRDGLQLEPADHRLWGMLARIASARRDWQQVIEYGERAGPRADFATLALLGDAYRATGKNEIAEDRYNQIEAGAADNPEPFARQWTSFRLDHDRELKATLAILEKESSMRTDVLGWDLLAWALYKNGRFVDARTAYQRALSVGTLDAVSYYHAAMIEKALGNDIGERRFLKRAREINPHIEKLVPQFSL